MALTGGPRRAVLMVAGKDPSREFGGHSSYVRTHARAAVRAGFEPHLFCVHRGAPSAVDTDFGVIHRVRSPFLPLGQVMAPAHRGALAAAIARFTAGRPGPHLLHSFGLLWGCVGAAARVRLARAGQRAVSVVSVYTTRLHETRGKLRGLGRDHGLRDAARLGVDIAWTRLVAGRFERQACREAARVLVNYDAVSRLVAGQYGAATPLCKIPYASEAAFVHADDEPVPVLPPAVAALEPAGAPLIVAVSRHDPRKGVDVLLRALARLRDEGVPFRACLIGPGPLLGAHRALAARLALGRSTAVPGLVPDPHPFLRHADVFVLPSLQEASGSLSLLEALQAGVAVVASDLDGVPEDVTDGDGALLVPPGDAPALAAALRRLLSDAPLRGRLARRGHELYRARFTAGALVEALRATYAELGFSA
jgi:glycosyltransferase involved in cell wall biosynthesis